MVPFVAILGPSEIASGLVKLKNMKSGEETTGTPEKIAKQISKV